MTAGGKTHIKFFTARIPIRWLWGIVIGFIALLAIVGEAIYWQILPQGAIGLLSTFPNISPTDRIVVFSPHPDDEALAAGGFLYLANHLGAQTWVVLVTDGNKHGLEQRRYAEFKLAMTDLGVPENHQIILGYPDGKLKQTDIAQLEDKFKDILDTTDANIVLAPHPDDMNPDHRMVGAAVSKVVGDRKLYQYLVHYHRYPQPNRYYPKGYMLPPIRLLGFSTSWVNLPISGEAFKAKAAAIRAYASQRDNPFLHELFYSMLRSNEVFATATL